MSLGTVHGIVVSGSDGRNRILANLVSVVDQSGWTGASSRGYRLDRFCDMLAPAFGRGLLGEFAKGADSICAPVLVMIEKSDSAPIHRGVDIVEKALSSRDKAVRLVRYDGGGRHELFYDVGYWWADFTAFLREHLAGC